MMEKSVFTAKTPVFEGPLELLLEQIEKRKLMINEVSLAKVADDYIAYIRQFENFPIPESASFILVASTLVLIKSKSLLPALQLTESEQGDIKNLEMRLVIYKRLRDAAEIVAGRFATQPIYPFAERPQKILFSPAENVTQKSIFSAIMDVMNSLPVKEFLPKVVVQKVIRLEEMMENLTKRIQAGLRLSFKEFAKVGKEQKVNVIVSFLAMLELVKQGIIDVVQNGRFDDIEMETENLGVPKY